MIGTRLGQYRIEALIGQGGMGAVYLATDEMLERQVAIKVLREQVEGHGIATERFRSEAQILSRLDHPHILRLYGFSQHEGLLYMVTEYVQGEALLRRLERGPVERELVLEWAGQVLDALDYAHQLGVVHRDIKPANILIDERGRARLLDFGIARIVGADGPTQTGQAVGTLTYMAPEQVLDEPIDGRADIYAFAVVVCQMLAGRRPYRATTTAGLIREIVDGPSPEVAALLPPESAALAPALMRALARFPAERTPTASQLRLELMAAAAEPALPPLPLPSLPHLAGGSGGTPVAPPSPVSGGFPVSSITTGASGQATVTASTIPVAPPAQRRKAGALVLVVPILLLLTGAAVALYLFTRPRPVDPAVAVAPPASEAPVVQAEALPPPSTPDTATPGGTDASDIVPATPAPQSPPEAVPAPPTLPARSPSAARPTTTAPPAARPAPAADDTIRSSDPAAGAAASEPARVVEAIPPAAPSPAPRASGARPTVEFKNMILMDRIDDEDEEIDVSIRLDGRRVVVIDEDGIAKRSIAYESIERATYNTRKPGRFSFRRGPSHWLTLEVGTTPIVLRLNGKTYEEVLTTLSGRGVHVQRNQ